MTEEAYRLLGFCFAASLIAYATGMMEPFAYQRSFESFSIKPYFGWLALLLAISSALYSVRKRMAVQLPGPLALWKMIHVVLGLAVLVAMYLHSGGMMGHGISLVINSMVVALLLTGAWGVVVQGAVPKLMTESLQDPVYKSELQDDVNEILEEISALLKDRSLEFRHIYQRHILPAISIERPTEGNQNALYQRFDPASTDPNCANRDLEALSHEETEVFYAMAEKVMDIVEIRRSQGYQGIMNRWLLWHIGLTSVLGVGLFFHVLSSLYF